MDAAELFAHGLNLTREHIEPTARMHHIEIAGFAQNVVPHGARISMMARDVSPPKVNAITEWVSHMAEGAALGTQTRSTFTVEIGMAEMIPNETLALRVYRHLLNTPLGWSAEEQAFAKAGQKEMGLKEAGLATTAMPFIKDDRVGGSSDVADVSWNSPVARFGWATHPFGMSLHTWAVTACGGMSIGDKASLASAANLAAVGYDLLTDTRAAEGREGGPHLRLDGRKYQAVRDNGRETWDESARRFGKGLCEEAFTWVDGL